MNKNKQMVFFFWAHVDMLEEESSGMALTPLFKNQSINSTSKRKGRVNFPREWEELMLPDKADITKEQFKFTFRKIIFYTYFITLLTLVRQFPSRIHVSTFINCKKFDYS